MMLIIAAREFFTKNTLPQNDRNTEASVFQRHLKCNGKKFKY